MTAYQRDEWLAILKARFGESPAGWAFICPQCGDVATGLDMRAALIERPRGETVASDILGQECIGRTLGALSKKEKNWDARRKKGEVRGCDWAAYGLFHGPDVITYEVPGLPGRKGETKTIYAFAMAPGPIPEED
jgi:hypothetical protein